MTTRKATLKVTVSGPPIRSSLTFTRPMGPAMLARSYRVISLSRDYAFRDGNWTPQRWGGAAVIVKKDGSLGVSKTTYLPYNFEPDAETARQFDVAADSLMRQAAEAIK